MTWINSNNTHNTNIQLMKEIRLTSWYGKCIYHYLQGFIHPRWCRISSTNSIPETYQQHHVHWPNLRDKALHRMNHTFRLNDLWSDKRMDTVWWLRTPSSRHYKYGVLYIIYKLQLVQECWLKHDLTNRNCELNTLARRNPAKVDMYETINTRNYHPCQLVCTGFIQLTVVPGLLG